MRKYYLLAGAFLALAGNRAAADENEERQQYHKWMETAGSTMKSLKKNIDGKSNEAAAKEALLLHDIYLDVEKYSARSKMDDAVNWSRDGAVAAKALATAAAAGDSEESLAAFGELSASCKSCHSAYRETLPDGKYRWKKRAAEE